jgi:hypothetical protein
MPFAHGINALVRFLTQGGIEQLEIALDFIRCCRAKQTAFIAEKP